MTEAQDSVPDAAALRARAAETHVVVVGGGVSGMVAALECAKVGMRVTLLEAAERLGGAIRTADVGGLTLDVGAESYATRGGSVSALIAELGLADRVVVPAGGRAWLAGIPGVGAAPMPAGGVLGIPENPFAPEVRRVIGWSGSWRAYLDRLRPVLTIGHEHSLGALVRSRMGRAVLERLVAPVVQGVYSAEPDTIDVDAAAPGLNAALTRVGSLSGAVAVLRGERDPALAPGSAVEGLVGGMRSLVDALHARLVGLGVDIRTGARVDGLSAASGANDRPGWSVTVLEDAPENRDAAAPAIAADAVIVATEEIVARALLAPAVPGLAPQPDHEPPVVDVVTLVLDTPALDAAPRGSGVLTVPGSHRAKALTHASAKWAWVGESARAARPHRHVVRVSFGSQGEPPATADLDGAAAIELAREQAAQLLGVDLSARDVVAGHIERYAQSQPASVIGRAARVAAARTQVHAVPGLAVVGAWIAGTGLAQVVPDARDEAERTRAQLLWG
ncbi:MAG: protoporphyrinogen oxidase [Microbacterium sp.]|uniref:protoporphyrinogen oxidase n=1 Tax=Microbacterium sp. TaxID=51671 RepID=UPI000DB3C8D4|nr:protoporphyrinogen oxidase [Microbacterium sp.]PZU41096.1 MAG: protoporphyrinogen oxidase [Microbacterium sp.]